MTPLPSETLLLEQLPVAVQRQFTHEFMADGGVPPEILSRVFEDAMCDMVVELRSYILAERLAEKTITVSFKEPVHFFYPTSWWQVLKRDFFPRWYLRRWPHRETYLTRHARGTRRVLVEQFALFPATPIRTPLKTRGPMMVRYERAAAVDSP